MTLFRLVGAFLFCLYFLAHSQLDFPPLEEVILEKAPVIKPFRLIKGNAIPLGIEKEKKDYNMFPDPQERFPRIECQERIPRVSPYAAFPGLMRIYVNSTHKVKISDRKWNERPVKWSWQIPIGYTKNSFKTSNHGGYWGDLSRFYAYLFYSNPKSGLPPLLCYFDSLKGLVWKKPFPMKEFVLQSFERVIANEDSSNYVRDMMMSGDGSRLFFALDASTEDTRNSSVLLMSDTGKMIRTLHLAGCAICATRQGSAGNDFFSTLIQYKNEDGKVAQVTTLFDREANLIGNFVNLKGELTEVNIEASGLHATREYGASGKPQNFDLYDLTNLVPFRKSIPENEVLDRPK